MVFSAETKEQFAAEMKSLYREAQQDLGKKDLSHLKKMEWWGRFCTLAGYATAWLIPNPISIFLISQGLIARWLLMHHINHRGYDQVPGVPPRYTSQKFAMGWRRFIDWPDWMLPRAWDYEHNFLHHFYTGEDQDPDVPERNARLLRNWNLPYLVKLAIFFLVACTWKFSYYSANTLNSLETKARKKNNHSSRDLITLTNFWDWRQPLVRQLWFQCWLPYVALHFILLPALFLPLGLSAVVNVLVCRLGAEVLTNLHTFLVIVTNHAGDDIYRYDNHYTSQAEYYLAQTMGSVNFRCGGDFNDFLHMWLNYQIEHHLFPNLPMRQYQMIQPKVKAVCEKHGVPYTQHSVWHRLTKLTAVCIGTSDMPHWQWSKTAQNPS